MYCSATSPCQNAVRRPRCPLFGIRGPVISGLGSLICSAKLAGEKSQKGNTSMNGVLNSSISCLSNSLLRKLAVQGVERLRPRRESHGSWRP